MNNKGEIKMRYAGIIKNDVAAAPGICTTLFVQGCPIHCPDCHNKESWDFNGGKEFSVDTIKELINALQANGINRTLCIMGGEPLCPENVFLTRMVIEEVKKVIPNIKIYIWTGYEKHVIEQQVTNHHQYILNNIDCLISGPYIAGLRDVTLTMRGSNNQEITYYK